jgi:hypothetical protein
MISERKFIANKIKTKEQYNRQLLSVKCRSGTAFTM